MNPKPDYKKLALTLALSSAVSLPLAAQTAPTASKPAPAAAPAPATPPPTEEKAAADEDVVVLSPFEVTAESEKGYTATDTLAGNRLNTDIRDLGNAITVVNSQFLKDIGATSSEGLLQYTTGTEIGGTQGNFAGLGNGALLNETSTFTNPSQNNRVRGLTAAEYTRGFFKSDMPWDAYNVERMDFQRGANSILFGQGSPAGIINTLTKEARFKNSNELELRIDENSSYRTVLDVNRELIDDQLALRVIGLNETEKFKQKPAYERDRRVYAATRWEPEFMRKGVGRTVIKANFEAGNIRSNRPRMLPPIDLITPWFYTGTYTGTWTASGTYRDPVTKQIVNVTKGAPRTFNNLNKQTFNPFQLQDDNTGRPNHGQQRPGINGGTDSGRFNPYFQPWIGNFAQSFGGPLAYYGSDTTAAPSYFLSEWRTRYSINSSGVVDNGGIVPFHRQGGINTMDRYAVAAGLPYSQFGVYRNNNLTDATVFDFYNNLIDGPNKKEWQDFRNFNVNLAQTFFNDKVGFELVYDSQFYKNGQLSVISDGRQAIYIDFMSVYSDGTPTGSGGEPFQNGTPNPNLGRAFISDSAQYGNNSYRADREAMRATVFARHNFAENNKGLLGKILGSHTITGLAEKDEYDLERRSWQRYAVLDPAYWSVVNPTAAESRFDNNLWALNHVIYLGGSLINRSSASGAYLPAPTVEHVATGGQIRAFDSHWNKPTDPAAVGYVNPGAVWINEYYPEILPPDTPFAARTSTQSENPANYVGWRNVGFAVTDSETSQANQDLLTRSYFREKWDVKSKGFVWQGKFWDNAFVGTFGARNDTINTAVKSLDINNVTTTAGVPGHLNLSAASTALPAKKKIADENSVSWGGVVHLEKIIGDILPIRISAYYAQSTNFQPAGTRTDFYGEVIGLPEGKTNERGLLFETKDGKYSLKVNKYQTEAKNASSSGLSGGWFLGASQAWAGNWANRFEYNWTGDTSDAAVLNPDPTNTQYNYGTAPGETLAQAQAREAAAVAAWRAWQKSVDPRFYTAWGLDITNLKKALSASAPAGFTLTEDSTSKGYEIEVNANPLPNWRFTLNAAQTKASRRNIGGVALADFISKYEAALNNTAAGDLRIWWGGAGNETSLFQWNANVGSEWAARALQEGTGAPELRKWRWNAITNYDFREGFLKGGFVGVGARWQDTVIIGYKPVDGAVPTKISYDIANPYKGPSELNFDLWFGYQRKLSDGIDWRIQVNVSNLFEGNGLIPITTQPDGTPAGYRIAPSQRISLTNTFKF